ncbi:MAG: hypothetical protein JWO48_2984 [Bryobacterales bacterium]|nr:hypothetical protein [Bryobacterales bacterium]
MRLALVLAIGLVECMACLGAALRAGVAKAEITPAGAELLWGYEDRRSLPPALSIRCTPACWCWKLAKNASRSWPSIWAGVFSRSRLPVSRSSRKADHSRVVQCGANDSWFAKLCRAAP